MSLCSPFDNPSSLGWRRLRPPCSEASRYRPARSTTGEDMRILLVSPPSGDLTIGLKHLSKVEPLGLEIIGASVPEHQVELLDMELDTDLPGALQRFQPDIVGASAQI